ncbi:MAG: InlB B-repeat-containing protein [Lachnospiraceae bacterium]|nr:InlB B-repeat-containing protein [Lachnospiraceae bacterium]
MPSEFIPEPNAKIDLSNYKCTKEGYIFDGWEYGKTVIISDDPEEQNAYRVEDDYEAVNSITNDNCDSLDYKRCYDEAGFGYLVKSFDIKLRAKWRSVYTLKFYAESDWDQEVLNDYSGTMVDQIIDENVDIANATINPVGFNRIGYAFDSWRAYKTTANGGDKFFIGNVQDKSSINNLVELGNQYPGNVFELYAQWKVDPSAEYTISFDNNFPSVDKEDYLAESLPLPTNPSNLTEKIWVDVTEEVKKAREEQKAHDVIESLYDDFVETQQDVIFYRYALVELPDSPRIEVTGDPRHYDDGEAWYPCIIDNEGRFVYQEIAFNPRESLWDEEEQEYTYPKTLHPINDIIASYGSSEVKLIWQWYPYQYCFDFIPNCPFDPDMNMPDSTDWLNVYDTVNIPEINGNDKYTFAGWVFDVNNISAGIILAGDNTPVKNILRLLEKTNENYEDYINQQLEYENNWNVGDNEYKLYGVWKEKHTVTFDYCEPTGFELDKKTTTVTVIDGEKVAEPSPAPSYEGWIFDGWYYDAEEKIPVAIPVIVDRPLNVDGLPNNGNLYAPNPMPNDPGEGDEGDDSWVKYDFDSLVLGDFTLVAKWKEIPTHTVKYCDGDDAALCITKEITYDEGDIILSENKGTDDAKDTSFNKPGSTLVGWIERTDAGDIKYELGGTYRNFNRDIYLFADWSPNEDVTLVFDGNGGKGETKSITGPEGNNVYLPTDYERIGYKLVGWDRDPETKEAEFTFENGIALFEGKVYAIWEPENYIIQLDYNPLYWPAPCENPEPYDPQPYSDESKVAIPMEVDDPYYNFIGWSLDPENTVADIYTENTTVKKIVDEADGLCIEPSISENEEEKIFTLYGVWKRKIAYIKFLPGAEDVTGNMDTQIFNVNEYQKLTKNAFERKGYSFLGWKCEGVENLFADERTIRMTEEETVELTAVWEKLPVAIWNDENGNELYSAPIDDPENLPPYGGQNPTKTGYDFAGWDGPKDGDNGNKVFTPKFTPKSNGGGGYVAPNPPAPTYYTITWIDGDNNLIYTEQVAEGSTPVYNKVQYGTPTKNPTGYATYSFNNTWSPAITKVTGNQEYVAQFDMFGPEGGQENPTPTPTSTPTPAAPAEYDIEYYEELPDGTEVQLKKTNNPDKYTYGVGAEIKYGIDKEGYTFEGWYSKRSKKYVKKVGTKTKGTVKLYAIFVPDDSGKGNEGDNGKGLPTDFSTLFVRLIDYTENSMTLKWEKMEYVDGYDILGSRCNSKDVIRPYEPIVSVDADTDEYVMSDLLAKTYYKFYVRAFILVNGEKRYITTSINVHGVTLNDTYGVADELEIEKVVAKYINGKSKTKYVRSTAADDGEINITLKVGQSLKIVTSEYNRDGKEIRAHRPISFESSDPAICKIGKKSSHKYGVVVADKANTYKSHTITALAAGECDIYVFAQNGVYKTIHVTVK